MMIRLNYLNHHNWSIARRLLTITLFPLLLLWLCASTYFYASRGGEVDQDLNERGALLASTLAAASEYGVMSGNISYLEKLAAGLHAKDKNIAVIDVINARGERIVHESWLVSSGAEMRSYEMPIVQELVELEPFDDNGLIAESSDSEAPVPVLRGKKVGVVRVKMTAEYILAKQQHRNNVASLVILAAVLMSGTFGLILARSLTRPLVAIIGTLKKIGAGAYDVAVPRTSGGEIGQLEEATGQMSARLEAYRTEMELEVASRTEKLVVAKEEALKSSAEKRKLIQKVNLAAEEERRSMAIEIHDHLNASLIVIRLENNRVLQLASREPSADVLNRIAATAQSIESGVAELYHMARDIVKRLRPEIIDTLGLRDAVQEMVGHYDSYDNNCKFKFEARGDFTDLNADLAIICYRLVQEALSNVVKHAHAQNVLVDMSVSLEKDALSVVVADDGSGFDSSVLVAGIGLIGMRERVYGADGDIEITSGERSGTIVKINLPINADT